MKNQFIAKHSIMIKASAAEVWTALVNPELIRQYMFGTNVETDWRTGSLILFKGERQGRNYEDKGVIIRIEPERILQYSYFSPLSGKTDEPQNYHIITIELSGEGDSTTLSLTQDNNPDEQARKHSEKNWSIILESLKKLLEGKS